MNFKQYKIEINEIIDEFDGNIGPSSRFPEEFLASCEKFFSDGNFYINRRTFLLLYREAAEATTLDIQKSLPKVKK